MHLFCVLTDAAEIIQIRSTEAGKPEFYVHYEGCKYSPTYTWVKMKILILPVSAFHLVTC